jgi:hypothetical protein
MHEDYIKLSTEVNKMKKVCGLLSRVTLVGLVLFSLFFAIVLTLQVYGLTEDNVDSMGLLTVVYSFLLYSLMGCLFFIAWRMFSDVAKGESPFSMTQVKRFTLVGIILLAFTLLDALLPLMVNFVAEAFGYIVGLTESSTNGLIIKVNILALVAALSCFGLAYVFKYGILLQELSDETL